MKDRRRSRVGRVKSRIEKKKKESLGEEERKGSDIRDKKEISFINYLIISKMEIYIPNL